MNYILFDGPVRDNLLPFTFTRPTAELRIGILTIREKWEKYLKVKTSTLTEDYLSTKYPLVKDKMNILINGSVLPNAALVKEILNLKPNQSLIYDDYIIASCIAKKDLINLELNTTEDESTADFETKNVKIKVNYLWDLFSRNGEAIVEDFKLLTKGRKSIVASKMNTLICPENIFIEKGAKIECAVLNASSGPIYIGKDTEIMEGSIVRGPFALCEHSTLKLSSKIYGPTTIGPHCKVGGEVNNSVFFGYSNKAHDGFIGNSVIGEWCNLGADTNNSNLKNNYSEVKLWHYPTKRFESTGLQFCGLFMGDHSKCGINTMFNTGTVVGVSANIFGHGYQRNFIPSFSWGGISGYSTFDIGKALEVAEEVYKRRDIPLTTEDINILKNVFRLTFEYRNIK